MNRWLPQRLAVLLLLVSLATGCKTRIYKAETTWLPDGKIDRAIYQPAKHTPKEILDPKRWKELTYAPESEQLDKEGWPASITKFPKQERDEKHPYLVARQVFASPQDVPNYVALFDIETASGKLARECQIVDYGFVKEYGWKETLTDTVTLADMRKARDELTDLLISLGEEVFKEELGKEYDGAELFKWLRKEGKTSCAEVTDCAYVAMAVKKKDRNLSRILEEEIGRVGEGQGLKWLKDGKLIDEKGMDAAFEDFLVDLLVKRVRTKDGKEVDHGTAVGWIKEFKHDNEARKKTNRFEEAADRIIAQKYGGMEAWEKRVDALLVRIFGLYIHAIGNPMRFAYSLKLPGEIVETNGKILSVNRVRWEFPGGDAYPLGYEMACRSLAANLPDNLAKQGVLGTKEALLEYVEIVSKEPALIDIMRDCAKNRDTTALLAHRKKLATDESALKKLRKVDRLMSLLKGS